MEDIKFLLSCVALCTGVILFIPRCSEIIMVRLYEDANKKLLETIARAEERIKISANNNNNKDYEPVRSDGAGER